MNKKFCTSMRYLKTPAIVVKDLLGFSHFCYLSKPGRERLKMVHQSTLKKSLACILWNGHFAFSIVQENVGNVSSIRSVKVIFQIGF